MEIHIICLKTSQCKPIGLPKLELKL